MATKKGMSLPLETVILLILAAIVLWALIAFFFKFYPSAQNIVEVTNARSSLCQQIVSADPHCSLSELTRQGKSGLATKLKSDVCGKPKDAPVCGSETDTPEQCITACCSLFCS